MNSKIPSLKITIISFLLFFINAFLLMYFGHFLKEYSDVPKIDFQINGYTIDTVKELFLDYGKSGRNLYFWMTIIDIPFPFLVAFFGYSYFGYTWKKWNFKIIYKLIIIAGFSFCLFDNIENLLIFKMLNNYPILNETEIMISSISTKIKLISLIIVYTAVPITLIISLIKLIIKKST